VICTPSTHLELVAPPAVDQPVVALVDRVLQRLTAAGGPMLRKELRALLRVNNQRLGESLAHLQRQGRVQRSDAGWSLAGDDGPQRRLL